MDLSHVIQAGGVGSTVLGAIDYFAWMSSYTGFAGYVAVIVGLLAAGLGVPIPEDIILIAGGWVSFEAGHNVWPMVLTGLVGIMAGDSVSFMLGRKFGLALTGHRFLQRILTPERVERVKGLLEKHGHKILIAARFMPGVRAVVFFTSGALAVPYWKFFVFDGLAALISAPLWIILGYRYGHQVVQWAEQFKWVLIAAGIVLAVVLVVRYVNGLRAAKAAAPASPPAPPTAPRPNGAE